MTNTKNTENNLTITEKIIDTAWKLFLEKGYDETTVDEIIEKSNTSKGSFYYHFSGKEEVLFCIAYYFDVDYKHWLKNLDPNLSSLEKLKKLDHFVMKNIEDSPYRPLLATLYGLQVKTKFRRHIINPDREYYKIITQIIKEGIENREIKSEYTYQELTEWFAIIERGLTYDWCLNQGRYSLVKYSQTAIDAFINIIKT
ncbi:TetR family transcriptional regulator [Keratinibaculum paraultunense]|uniref:TetR family transcriptional regulator n=1 Tax=Keratinibaculum paraultunense TaxID=1278232 RepID=A0A4R3KV33_9FIRM|nr:TetR/AcrR family transcriptional regulator [Keratinibaculum paraultunense]QQY79253.1 TetR/AcrR family transcriptional regulator [Keratinibaculum paraultunense]TCS89383.1 TetR family transcriptional regulator [Keratinibaculum paraultunense]